MESTILIIGIPAKWKNKIWGYLPTRQRGELAIFFKIMQLKYKVDIQVTIELIID